MSNNSKFPTMGTSAVPADNVSGAPSKNTTPVIKKGAQSGTDAPTANARKGTLEWNGFKGAPQVMRSYQNAPEASATMRNVRLVPSAIGNRDFYSKRQFGQNTQ